MSVPYVRPFMVVPFAQDGCHLSKEIDGAIIDGFRKLLILGNLSYALYY